ncbi:hypothetical protein KUCAC02_034552, partial [Chaenocephalus aceratus]
MTDFCLYFLESLEENVKSGQNVTLRCSSSTDAAITLLEWKRPGLEGYVFFFRDNRLIESFQDPRYQRRVQLKDPEMKNGDASVLLKNVTKEDSGTYECWVITISNNRRKRNVRVLVRLVHLVVSEGPEKEINDEQPEGSRGHVGLGMGGYWCVSLTPFTPDCPPSPASNLSHPLPEPPRGGASPLRHKHLSREAIEFMERFFRYQQVSFDLKSESAVESVLSVSSVCPQCVLSLSSVCPQSVLSLSSVCPQSVLSVSQCVLSLSSVCPQCVLSLSSSVLSLSSVCPQSVLSLSSVCPQSVLSLSSRMLLLHYPFSAEA